MTCFLIVQIQCFVLCSLGGKDGGAKLGEDDFSFLYHVTYSPKGTIALIDTVQRNHISIMVKTTVNPWFVQQLLSPTFPLHDEPLLRILSPQVTALG